MLIWYHNKQHFELSGIDVQIFSGMVEISGRVEDFQVIFACWPWTWIHYNYMYLSSEL